MLLRVFRHATRRWHVEFPRGFAEAGETGAQTAARELTEEVGVPPAVVEPLGTLHTDTGMTSGEVGLFWARIDAPPRPGGGEGIDRVLLADAARLGALLDDGTITDSFTQVAVLKAERRGLPPFGGG
ncbi:NUDIX hydrolase [Actinomadura rayongensis]|uniref:NUDIX hydrolase n=1 Tax=Actinomadura rayongensis TaxID=1429076 RepID=UPI0035ECE311